MACSCNNKLEAKVLVVIVSDDLSWNAHVKMIVKKTSARVHTCLTNSEYHISVQRTYGGYVHPFCDTTSGRICVYLSDSIESMQKRSLRIMHPGLDYATALTATGIPTLRERRTDIYHEYFNKMKNPGHKLHGLLPDARQLPYKMRDASVREPTSE